MKSERLFTKMSQVEGKIMVISHFTSSYKIFKCSTQNAKKMKHSKLKITIL